MAAVPKTSAMSGRTVRITSVSRISGASLRPPPSRMSSPTRTGRARQQHHQQRPSPAEQAAQRDRRRGPRTRSSAAPGSRTRSRASRRSGCTSWSRMPAAARGRGHDPGEGPEVGGPDGEQAVDAARRRRRPGGAAARRPSARSSDERIVNRCGRSVMSRRMERKSPDAASRPAYTTRTASARRSTSSRMCEREEDHPALRRPSSRSSAIMCSRWRGSMPLNGSSSSRMRGSWTSAAASLARWRMPFE